MFFLEKISQLLDVSSGLVLLTSAFLFEELGKEMAKECDATLTIPGVEVLFGSHVTPSVPQARYPDYI